MVRLDDIRGADKNPKSHDHLAIMASIRRFGFTDFPTRNETTGKLVEGHGRVEALRAMQDLAEPPPANVVAKGASWFVPVVCGLSWATDDEAMAYLLAHNQLTMASGWTRDLGLVLQDLRSRQVDVIGWRSEQVTKMLAEVRAHQRAMATDEAPPPPAEPMAKLGDVWQLGDHLLYCGSCEDLPRIMGDARASLMVTDPPYGVDFSDKTNMLNRLLGGKRNETPIENDARPPAEMGAFWLRCFTAARAVLAPGAGFYISGPVDTLLMWHLQGALLEAGLRPKQQIVWAKNHLVLSNADYHGQHEPIFYGWCDGGHHRVTDRTQTTLWTIDKPHESKLHPTMKPVELYRRAIRNSSDAGQTVLEPFSGSGTCIVACEELGRLCVAAELSPAYVDVAVHRWEAMTGGRATLR